MFEEKYKERQRIISLIEDLYSRNPVGGYLHIVLDDHNIADSHLDFCLERIQSDQTNISSKDYEIYIDIINSMKQMTQTQRIKCIRRR